MDFGVSLAITSSGPVQHLKHKSHPESNPALFIQESKNIWASIIRMVKYIYKETWIVWGIGIVKLIFVHGTV
jgi:hypothetical protein